MRIGDLCAYNPKHPRSTSDQVVVSFVPMAAVSEVAGQITAAEDKPYEEVRKGFTHFADGDVIWAKITPCMENGKSAVASGLTNGLGCGSTEFMVLRSHGAVLPAYLHRFMRQESYRRRAKRTMKSGVGQARVPKEFVLESEVPLAPLNEQRRIVAKLEALQERSDAAKEALDAIPPLLERFRQSVLAAAFRGDLTRDWRRQNPNVEPASALLERIRAERKARFIEDAAEKARARAEDKARKSGMDWREADNVAVLEKERSKAEARYKAPTRPEETELPSLPPTWSWATYDEVVEVQLGQRRAPEFRGEEERPYIRSANITWSGLDLGDVKTMGFADPGRLLLKPGDVLLNEASGSKAEVGKPALWNGELSGCCFQATVLRLRAYSDELLPKWIYFH
ncbi:MAG: hypothetical protein KAI24_08180, partial [Planctomycetes bacterium]|nr:hypothetical protein [Planctomycetota bacterium]